MIELLNLDLERIDINFKRGDIKKPGYSETLASSRKTIFGCFTSELDPYREVACDAGSLKEYLKVDSPEDYHKKLVQLKKMNE